MALHTDIKEQLKDAMKAKDEVRLRRATSPFFYDLTRRWHTIHYG